LVLQEVEEVKLANRRAAFQQQREKGSRDLARFETPV
jgi:hypothetical protein